MVKAALKQAKETQDQASQEVVDHKRKHDDEAHENASPKRMRTKRKSSMSGIVIDFDLSSEFSSDLPESNLPLEAETASEEEDYS